MEPGLTAEKLPDTCLSWIAGSRLKFLQDMLAGRPMRYFSAHLPVMSTWREGNNEKFPVNMTVKGIGLVPREDLLADYIDLFEGIRAKAGPLPWEESLSDRVDAMLKLYSNAGNFDPTMLGGLEIFDGKASRNIRENPYASLLYVGMAHSPQGMKYTSFQVNGRIETLQKENVYYRYLVASRKLFEFDKFHLFQSDYPFGYLLRVIEVMDKSPWSKGDKRH